MKKIIFLLLISNVAFAQIDSNLLKVTVTVQARDFDFLGSFITNKLEYEDLYDAVKVKYRIPNPPTNQTGVTLDTIPIYQWLHVITKLRNDPLAILGSVYQRVGDVLAASSNTYLSNKITAARTSDTASYLQTRTVGRFQIRRQ